MGDGGGGGSNGRRRRVLLQQAALSFTLSAFPYPPSQSVQARKPAVMTTGALAANLVAMQRVLSTMGLPDMAQLIAQ